eukprot:CAMPEP_0172430098 /NCGR_PEP_ID=MMETSP1064-20121228/53090_1 /TAXON_ID=202472 /ORGANISM="Aulacoseira subarctica , Strain CCAP 1002/5" /LENGTH=347 /DNA_ID=CAMNT_0013175929 /DNA_START=272 /DNA_END=1315 /DNA_ORIENTATION=-
MNSDPTEHIDENSQVPSSTWSPAARKAMVGLASVGAVETGLLSYVKFTEGSIGIQNLCSAVSGSEGSCGLVLDSSYASIAGIPLTFYGFCAYVIVTILALSPMLSKVEFVGNLDSAQIVNEEKDSNDFLNRMFLLIATTSMATFSVYLVSIILFVLKTSCEFCFVSAALSVSLGAVAWFGGAAGNSANSASQTRTVVLGGLLPFAFTTLATILIYSNVENTTTLQSTTVAPNKKEMEPPPIVTASSERALLLSAELQSLKARFFGAFWCTHCYEQKERLGKEAMGRILYIECDREGKNSQNDLCKARKVPGYPTWEINGELFPGEQSIEELENIVKDVKIKMSALKD